MNKTVWMQDEYGKQYEIEYVENKLASGESRTGSGARIEVMPTLRTIEGEVLIQDRTDSSVFRMKDGTVLELILPPE